MSPTTWMKMSILINELRKRNPLLPEILFQDFLNVDSDVICTEEISDEQIIADIMNEKEELSYFEQDENEITQRPNKQLNGCQDKGTFVKGTITVK
ncbi:hypothetical protein AVEN_5958-1 [Araneus ventricosus]|uniref:Uncharacterized protein n=1 Tax=Araneus ventricosus TaxID=182803 RepID=A0A4Y2BCC8_ARAVE|nr:hypothetical protein AVEN_5958-1 [Araneus ventricosus]